MTFNNESDQCRTVTNNIPQYEKMWNNTNKKTYDVIYEKTTNNNQNSDTGSWPGIDTKRLWRR